MDSSVDTPLKSDDFARDLAILDWLVELGADEAICETPLNRYELPESAPQAAKPPKTKPAAAPALVRAAPQARALAQSCDDLESLRRAIAEFDGCALKKGARNMVFGAGNTNARVMIIGDSPDRAADQSGTPFAGPMGELLEKMLAAIGLSVDAEKPQNAVYLAGIIPWRSAQNRGASDSDIEMMKPFLEQHITLINPDFLVLMGSSAVKFLGAADQPLAKIRGQWRQVLGIAALPMFHPVSLMRSPAQKRAAWADLLSLKQKLQETNHE